MNKEWVVVLGKKYKVDSWRRETAIILESAIYMAMDCTPGLYGIDGGFADMKNRWQGKRFSWMRPRASHNRKSSHKYGMFNLATG